MIPLNQACKQPFLQTSLLKGWFRPEFANCSMAYIGQLQPEKRKCGKENALEKNLPLSYQAPGENFGVLVVVQGLNPWEQSAGKAS